MKSRRVADFAGIADFAPPALSLVGWPNPRLLVELAARRWGVRSALIYGRSRDQLVVAARHHAMWLLRTHTRLSQPQIGRLLGRDHTTVLAGIRRHEMRRAGLVPAPFVWGDPQIAALGRLLRRGMTVDKVLARLGIGYTDLLRCPGYSRLRQAAVAVQRNRLAQAALALKSREACHA